MTSPDSLLESRAEIDAARCLDIGAVDYLNTVPLIGGLERLEGVRVRTDVPANQVALLERDEVDLALCSSIDLVRCPVPLEVLPVGMLGCEGPTLTVRLFTSVPLERITRVACDGDSHTSVELLRTLLRERHGVEPELTAFDAGASGACVEPPAGSDALLLIGDKVVTSTVPEAFRLVEIDLGEAWHDFTGLPFVFATWLCRADRDAARSERLERAARLLTRTRLRNTFRIDQLAGRHAAAHGWPSDLAHRYLAEHLRYDLDERARAGMSRFLQLAADFDGPLPLVGGA